jgi:hypothetical protein
MRQATAIVDGKVAMVPGGAGFSLGWKHGAIFFAIAPRCIRDRRSSFISSNRYSSGSSRAALLVDLRLLGDGAGAESCRLDPLRADNGIHLA